MPYYIRAKYINLIFLSFIYRELADETVEVDERKALLSYLQRANLIYAL